MATPPPNTHKVRVQDLQPGMKVSRINADLDFVYPQVDKVVPQKVTEHGRQVTKSYKVHLVGYVAGRGMDAYLRPFIVRPTTRLDVIKEN